MPEPMSHHVPLCRATPRRLFNQLIAYAHGPDMGERGYKWTVPLAELRGSHNANDRLQDSLLALMRVVVTVHHPDGRTTTNVRLLGDNETDRKAGTLTFELSQKLVELMRDSTIFGKLEIRTMTALTSKYALALYEMVARRARLNFVFSENFTLERIRELLGVPEGKLKQLRQPQQIRHSASRDRNQRLVDLRRQGHPDQDRPTGDQRQGWLVVEGRSRTCRRRR